MLGFNLGVLCRMTEPKYLGHVLPPPRVCIIQVVKLGVNPEFKFRFSNTGYGMLSLVVSRAMLHASGI